MSQQPVIEVDLDAIAHNVEALRRHTGVDVIAVVKADGYGHGMVPVAAAARRGGATGLAVATPGEALRLRAAGDTGRLLAWLNTPGEDLTEAVAADIDLTAYSVDDLRLIAAASDRAGRPARLQVKVDTGLNRGGARPEDLPDLLAQVREGMQWNRWQFTGIWSHFACADEPDHPANAAQEAVFAKALDVAEDLGLAPESRHLANSAGALLRRDARYDMVRCGIATYGLDPTPADVDHGVDLRPAMTLRAPLVSVKPVSAGESVSYGHTWTADRDTLVGLVPLGYGDGIPRAAGNRAEVAVAGERRPIAGRVCMDQLVVDLGPDSTAQAGDEVVVFGDPATGAPSVDDWARAVDTINYEIVTRIGGNAGRIGRRYTGTGDEA